MIQLSRRSAYSKRHVREMMNLMESNLWRTPADRRMFIGGSDARIIMGSDEAGLVRLWREKRGETEPEDLSSNLIVQLGTATEELNRCWYERDTGRRVTDAQRRVKHSAIPWMAATQKYMAQLQHNMWVTHLRTSVLSIITGGGKWVENHDSHGPALSQRSGL